MIFDKEYDKSLWLIIAGEKDNRGIIVDFVKSIPEELYQRLSLLLEKYNEYISNGVDIWDLDEEEFKSEVLVSNCKYYFAIDLFLNSLSVGKCVLNDCNEYINTIEIRLYTGTTYNSIETFGEQILGAVSSDSYHSLNRYYDLISTVFGKMVVSSSNRMKRFKRVDIKMIPDDINTDELLDKNIYVRRRKK